jgi:hypothetical protein
MEGQRGIYIIKFPHFTLINQEKDLGRQGNHEEAVFDMIGFSLRRYISLAPASSPQAEPHHFFFISCLTFLNPRLPSPANNNKPQYLLYLLFNP